MDTQNFVCAVLCCVDFVFANQLYALSNRYKGFLPNATGVLDVANVTVSRCTLECISIGCTSIFYNTESKDCRLYMERPFDMGLETVSGWKVYQREGEISSWATELIAVSSEYKETEWNGEQALGKPDVYPKYDDYKNAWASASRDLPHEWIQLRFSETMYIKQIHIYEVYHAGGVKEISGRRPDLGWEILWKTNTVRDIKKSRIFKPELKPPYFKTDVIRITVDGTVCKSWPEIDAVMVVGDFKAH